MRIILPLFCLIMLSGCTGVGAIVLQAVSAADLVSGVTTDKSITDNVISEATGKDCKVFRVFKDRKICRGKEIRKLIDMDCRTYYWDEHDEPHCREDKSPK
jgi:hypothetical protein